LFRGKKLTAGEVSLYAVLKSGAKTDEAAALAIKLKPPGTPEVDAELVKFGLKDKWLGIIASKKPVDAAQEIKVAPADAKWILTTDTPNSRLLAENVDDLLLVSEYSVG
jgi:hypothetical protein